MQGWIPILVAAGVPDVIVSILCHWYGILRVNVRWGTICSQFFAVFNGVRLITCYF